MSTIQVINAKHPSSASNNIVLDSSGNATFAGTAAMASSFLRNRIINGGFDVWQRGTSGFSTSPGTYTADRWRNDQVITVVRSTDVPNSGSLYSFDVTQGPTSFGTFVQRIESLNCYDLVGRQVTLSFWARSVSGSVGLNVILRRANAVDDFSGVTNIQTINLVASSMSGSWVFYTATFSALPSQASNGLEVTIYRDQGSAQTRYAQIQLEVGSAATPFERRQYGQELALCQRYCFVLDNSNNLGNGFWGSAYGTDRGRVWGSLPVTMRAYPTVTGLSGTNTFELVGGGGVATANVQFLQAAPNCITFDGTSLSTTAFLGQPLGYRGPGVVSAEL